MRNCGKARPTVKIIPVSDPRPSLVTADRFLAHLREYGSCLVALSGGVDSAVVAQGAWLALPGRAWAVTGISAAVGSRELADARAIAERIGIPHRELPTEELANPAYQRNAVDRCFHCKTELYRRLTTLADSLGAKTIANGANLDDLEDYRPGMRAAGDFNVRSPLVECGLGKSRVRELAAHWELPLWDKPASPCLSSRIAHGVEVTPERLRMVEDAETYLRRSISSDGLRVRCHAGELARIEVDAAKVPELCREPLRSSLVAELRRLGFRAVTLDLEGFRSGNLHTLVGPDEIARGSGVSPLVPPI